MKRMLSMRIFWTFTFLLFQLSGFSQCANAGSDTLFCSYRFGLKGEPSGGQWSYLCQDSTRWVELGGATPDGQSSAAVAECGTYLFVYSVSDINCTDSDTVAVSIEDPVVQNRSVSYNIGIEYGAHGCQGIPYDSCGNIRVFPGVDPPTPRWSIEITSVCEATYPMAIVSSPDSSTCLATINHLGTTTIDTATTLWTSTQTPFVQVDFETGTILNNRFDEFISILEGGVQSALDSSCYPFAKCFIHDTLCADTVIDILPMIMPVHLGGYWSLIDSAGSTPLEDTTDLSIGGKDYRLIIATGSRFFGRGDIQFELYGLTGNQMVSLDTSIELIFFWTEDWTLDTLEKRIPRVIPNGNCIDCGDLAITYDTLKFPDIPTTFCPTIGLIFNPPITAEITGDSSICEDGFVILSGPIGYDSYNWSNGTTSRFNFIQDTGIYELMVTDSSGCTATDAVRVRRVTAAEFEIRFDSTQFCENACTDFEVIGSGISRYNWSNGSSGAIATYCFDDEDIEILVVLTDTAGCRIEDTIFVQVVPTTTISAGPDQVITCDDSETRLQPDSVALQASPYYKWVGPGISGSNQFDISPIVDEPGVYVLFNGVDSMMCLGRDSVIVRLLDDAPDVFAGDNVALNCEVQAVRLNGRISQTGPNIFFYWEGPGINAGNRDVLDPIVDQVGEYVLFGCNDLTGCCTTDTVAVGQNISQPRADAGPDKRITCDTTSVTIGGNNTTTGFDIVFEWSGPDITAGNRNEQFPTVRIAGIYVFRVIDTSSRCFSEDAVLVQNVGNVPVANAGMDVSIDCASPIATLSSAGSSTGMDIRLEWIGPGINAQNRFNPSPRVTVPGTYILKILDESNNCESTDTVTVTRNTQPPIISAGRDLMIDCMTEEVELEGLITNNNGQMVITWSGPGIGNNLNELNPRVSSGGLYLLTVRDTSNSCLSIDSMRVIESFDPPGVSVTQDVELNCDVSVVAITAQLEGYDPNTQDFFWSGPGIDPGDSRDLQQIVSMPGVYVASIITGNPNCIARDTVVVSADTTAPDIDAGEDQVIGCDQDSITLEATTSDALRQVEWSTTNGLIVGPTDNLNVQVARTGTYIVSVTGENGCLGSDTVEVEQWESFDLITDVIQTPCGMDSTAIIRLGVANGTPPFSFSVNGQPFTNDLLITGLPAGDHIIEVRDGEGCTRSFDVTIESTELFSLPDTVEVFLCEEPELEIGDSFGYNNVTILWKDNPSLPVRRAISGAGIYDLEFRNMCDTAVVSYSVINEMIADSFSIALMPNAFTPNGDDLNDQFGPAFQFEIDNLEVADYEFTVRSRWGQLIFETNTPGEKWDGNYNGEPAQPDIYIYFVSGEITDCVGNKKPILESPSGNFMLLR